MRSIASLLFTCIITTLCAQIYHPFPNVDDTLSFVAHDSLVRFITFDSVSTTGQKSMYYMQEELGYRGNLVSLHDSCALNLYDTAWVGYKIEYASDTFVMRNTNYELGFNPANLDSSITYSAGAYNKVNQYLFYVRYLGQSFDSVHNGQLDSIRHYEITIRDTLGNKKPSASPILIAIAKNYGLQSIPALNSIPSSNSWNPNHHREHFELLTKGEVYDFEVGDEFQYSIYHMQNNVPKPLTYETWEVTSKSVISGNKVSYTYSVTHDEYDMGPMGRPINYRVLNKTVNKTYDNLQSLITPNLTNEPGHTYVRWYKGALFGRDGVKIAHGYYWVNDSCLAPFLEPHNDDQHYARGLGQTLDAWEDVGISIFRYRKKLVYYSKQGGDTYGTKYNIGYEELEEANIRFYPNPARDLLNVEGCWENITITDLGGREVFSRQNSLSGCEKANLRLPQLAEGVYLINIDGHTEKLIIDG